MNVQKEEKVETVGIVDERWRGSNS